jgi:flagellar hook-length control protein FliK
MEQAIQAVASGKADSKAFSPADLLKMIDASNGKGKGEKTKPGKEGDDINALAPFLQLLNQQITLLFQTDKGSGADLINKDGEKITLEQAKLLFQGNPDLKGLEQGLAKLGDMITSDQGMNAQSESPGNSLLKEISLLEKNLAAGDIKSKDILLDASLGQTITDETLSNGNKAAISDAIATALNKKVTTKTDSNGNELKIVNDSVLLNDKNNHIPVNTFPQPPETELKKVTGMKFDGEKGDNNNLQLKNGSGDGEVKVKAQGKEYLAVLKNNEKTLKPETIILQEVQLPESPVSKVPVNSAAVKEENQIGKNILPAESGKDEIKSQPEKMIFKEAQFSASPAGKVALNSAAVKEENQIGKNILPAESGKDEIKSQPEKVIFKEAQFSASPAGKVAVNSAAVKEENQIGKNILSDESGKVDQAAHNNSRISTQELKESLIGKDNLRFAQEQYQNAAASANAGDKAKIASMQAILGELSDKTKPEQKTKTIAGEIRNEETSLSSINGTGSGAAKIEKTNDVSPGEIISQVTNGIKETAANDGGRVKITLNPPSLGTVEMDVIVHNNRVEVVLTADNKDVQQTLNNHIDKLKGSLQTQGLTIERCDVMMQDKREEYHQSFSQHAFYHQGSGQGNNSRQNNSEEKFKFNGTATAEQRVNVLTASTDKISLFA